MNHLQAQQLDQARRRYMEDRAEKERVAQDARNAKASRSFLHKLRDEMSELSDSLLINADEVKS